MATMMGDRPVRIPNDLVIWGSTAALGLVAGIGAAFTLWNLLRSTGAPGIADGAVAALGLGFGLVGFSSQKPSVRLFLLVGAGATLAAFFLGGGAFSSIAVG